jgi:hypothetical protein
MIGVKVCFPLAFLATGISYLDSNAASIAQIVDGNDVKAAGPRKANPGRLHLLAREDWHLS